MKKHALLSPSAAYRWIKCTRSARLEASLPERSSEYADEGSVAHELGELLILRHLKRIRIKQFQARLAKLKTNQYYDKAMMDLAEDYAAFVLETYAKALKIDPTASIFIEYQLDLSTFAPGSFGTADIIIMCDGYLWFIDFKYGQGVPVYAHENRQLMMYALGALEVGEVLYNDIEHITLIIYQPRIDNTSAWETTRKYLYTWAEQELRPQAELAFAGKGTFEPGSHCQFCNARPTCAAHKEHYKKIIQHVGKNVDLIKEADLIEILTKYKDMIGWLNSIHKWALDEAMKGRKIKGFKLVSGRGPGRKITDAQKAIRVLLKAGYTMQEITTEPELRGIVELQKLLGKDFGYHLNKLIVTPDGAPTLVPVSDKRKEITKANAAAKAFKDI